MPFRPTLLLVPLLLLGCGKKSTSPASAADGGSSPTFTAEMPDTEAARAYAAALVETAVTDFQPTGGGGGVTFEWDRLTFAPDGTWAADAHVEASFEEMPCRETGTWRMDSAASATVATLVWTVSETSCAAREAGEELRVQMELGGDAPEIRFR